MTWRRFKVLVERLPRESLTARAVDPRTEWGVAEYLLASAVDALNGANWQRTRKGTPRPKPVVRPGSTDGPKHWGRTRTREEVREILDQINGPRARRRRRQPSR